MREALQGALQDYVRASGFACVKTEDLLRDLVSRLASYREEDVALFPEVYVLAEPSCLATIAPGMPLHTIGTCAFGLHGADRLLQDAAGLADSGWAIYVTKLSEERFEYGVFRSRRHSFSTTAEESMDGLQTPVLVLRNRGHLSVELLNTNHDSFSISLTSAVPSESQLPHYIKALAEAATESIDQGERARFQAYLESQLGRILQHCHGTLIAVVESPGHGRGPEEMLDGVWLAPHVDLLALHRTAVASATADSLADLQAAEALLSGMISRDGVVVLSTDGTVRAYRVFLAPTAEEKQQIPDRGGGRRRTFALMQLRTRAGQLRAAFFRSQDGTCDCERAPK